MRKLYLCVSVIVSSLVCVMLLLVSAPYSIATGAHPVTEATNLRSLQSEKVEAARKRVATAEADCAMARSVSEQARRSGNKQAETIAREAETVAEDELRIARQLLQKALALLREREHSVSEACRGLKASCSEINAQLERDKEAIKRYEKTIAMNNEEADQWAKKNNEAQKEALKSAIEGVADLVGRRLLENKNIASELEKRLIDYRVQLQVEGLPQQKALAEKLIQDMSLVQGQFDSAMKQAAWGQALKTGVDLDRNYKMTRAAVETVKSTGEIGDKRMADVLQMIKDPENNLRVHVSDLIALAAEKKLDKILEQIPCLSNAAAFALFIRDYSYQGLAWYQSRERILGCRKVADEQLKAVASLQKQITETMNRRKECCQGPGSGR